jgi:hypothetical protein
VENVGIVLSVPAGFVCSVVYGFLLNRFVWQRSALRRAMRFVSLVVLGLIVVEVILLASMGAVRARQVFGPTFYGVHLVLFFAALPSLANVLMLKNTKPRRRYMLVVGCACAIFALSIVLMQYGVSEALYGINGNDGPFSGSR